MVTAQIRIIVKTVLATLTALIVVGFLSGYAILMSGIYNVASTSQHFQFVHAILEKGMHQSVRFHSRDVVSLRRDDPYFVRGGAVLFQNNCVECHGAPGIAPRGIGMGMQPVPGSLVGTAEKWNDREMYWIVKNGIKMSGMPAWEYRLQDEELWQLVAFLQHMPQLSPANYKALIEEVKR
tara:strand:+ start:18258 stop:18797 length:540 start_codon:yes stop_codon:yes gene_type:complete